MNRTMEFPLIFYVFFSFLFTVLLNQLSSATSVHANPRETQFDAVVLQEIDQPDKIKRDTKNRPVVFAQTQLNLLEKLKVSALSYMKAEIRSSCL